MPPPPPKKRKKKEVKLTNITTKKTPIQIKETEINSKKEINQII